MKLLFVSPIVSRRYAKDWNAIVRRAEITVESLARQSVSDWAVMFVGGDELPLPSKLKQHVIFVKADLDIDAPQRRGRREIDKQRKQYCGYVALHDLSPEFVMPLDYDDLVSTQLVEFVQNQSDAYDAFILKSGYVYTDGENCCYYSRNIYQRTGSNLIVRYRREFFPTEPSDFRSPPEGYLDFPFITSHIKRPETVFSQLGLRWRYIPFPAVVWRRNQDSISNAYATSGASATGGPAPLSRLTTSARRFLLRRKVNPARCVEFGCDGNSRFGF